MKTSYLILIIAIIVLVGYLFLRNKNGMKIEIAEIKDFNCQDASGFSFKYPVFKNWEVGEFKKEGQYNCKMFFDTSKLPYDYEIARQMVVRIIPKNNENKNNLSEFQNTRKFYGTNFDVQIGIMAGTEKEGFSEKIFWQTITDSFIFS